MKHLKWYLIAALTAAMITTWLIAFPPVQLMSPAARVKLVFSIPFYKSDSFDELSEEIQKRIPNGSEENHIKDILNRGGFFKDARNTYVLEDNLVIASFNGDSFFKSGFAKTLVIFFMTSEGKLERLWLVDSSDL